MEMLTTHNTIKTAIVGTEISEHVVADKTLRNYMAYASRGRLTIYAPLFIIVLSANQLDAYKFLFLAVLALLVVHTVQTAYAIRVLAQSCPDALLPPMPGFTFLSFLSGSLWGITMYPAIVMLGENVMAAIMCATILISVSLTAAMKAGQHQFVRAFLAGFALFQLPQDIYHFDRFGWILIVALTLLLVMLVRIAEILGRQSSTAVRVQMENKILADQLAVALSAATHFSQRDSLTGLLNRRAFEEAASDIKAKSHHDTEHAIILIDLDHFKSINDCYGHALGDSVLKTVAAIINMSVGPCDLVGRGDGTVARWGGEEFVILLNNCSTEQAACVAETIRSRLAEHHGQNWPDALVVTGSFGVAPWPSQNSLQSAISNADQAMYAAKRSGRNQTRVYSATS